MAKRDFLDIAAIERASLELILEEARRQKSHHKSGVRERLLEGKQLAMIFEKNSTRTRVSFEVAINHLGGNAIFLSSNDSQLGRGESLADTARVLSRYVDLIMIRTYSHNSLYSLAEFASVPVINGLTDKSHPCQVMADIMTFIEYKGDISGQKIAWVGDFNNMTNSWIEAAGKFDFRLNISCPRELLPKRELPNKVEFFDDPADAVKDADCVNTDTWVSMGDVEAERKRKLLTPFQVNEKLMKHAANNSIFMHCLPAHRGEEVTDGVIDGRYSAVWDEAENRLHIQKAIILWCCGLIPRESD